ncbi:hypothetical protein TrVFT333_007669 [Trichoderma virens FT-333]|nr:hypothetical protein TrVFT333_007669 [Trichoderma virens FT-333]
MAKVVSESPFNRADALDHSRLRESHEQIRGAAYPTSAYTPQQEFDPTIDHIPGEPTISLAESSEFLHRELATPILDELYNVLHLFARKLSSNVDALHAQIFKGRSIVAVEDPRFHLVRQERSVFIKPMPVCLLNYDFWTHCLASSLHATIPLSHGPDEPLCVPDSYRAMAMGFMRSYSHLIQHQSDLRIAKDRGLVPEDITWTRWSKFIRGFRLIHDEEVARRYRYGQLRLTRLNWAIFIFRPKSAGNSLRFYYQSPWSASVFIQYAAVPLAFIFASVSLILSSMQVMLTVPDDSLLSGGIGEGGLKRCSVSFGGFLS